MMHVVLVSNSEQDTMRIGNVIGKRLKGGECFELISDVGGGKTTFTKALVEGYGINADVISPTFTIQNLYTSHGKTVAHFDLYRLPDPGLAVQELAESLQSNSVVVVEWADTVKNILPDGHVQIRFEKSPEDETGRQLVCDFDQRYAYLFEDIS